MFEAVEGLIAEHGELEGRLGAPETHADARLSKKLNTRYSELSAVIGAYRDLQSLDEDFGHVHGLPVESRVEADAHPVEVLSLQ